MAIDVFTVNGVGGADTTINSADLISSNVVVDVSRDFGTTNGGDALVLVKDGLGNLVYWEIINLSSSGSSQQATIPVGSLPQGSLQFFVFQGTNGTGADSGTTTYPTGTQFDWHGSASGGNVAVTAATASDFTVISATLDTVLPTVSITLGDSALLVGETSTITFQFSETVQNFTIADVTGFPNGTLSSFTPVDGDTYTVLYTPNASVEDNSNIITVGTSWQDLAGNAPSSSTTSSNFTIDTLAPTVTITDDEAGTANIAGGSVLYTFQFSQAVTGFTSGDVTVVGGTKGTFIAVDSDTYTLVVTPDAGLEGSMTVDVAAGVATDTAGNGNTAATQSVQAVDTLAPALNSVAITSNAGIDNTYIVGDTVQVTATFSQAVTVTGTPQMTIDIGGVPHAANYVSGSGGTALVFSYTVQAGDTDANGIAISLNSLGLNGGTIKDGAGNDAALTHSGLADSASHLVDATPPAAPTALNLATADDSGNNIDNVTFNQTDLTITGNGEAGATVTLYDDLNNDNIVDGGEILATTAVTGGGSFGTDISLFTQGVHHIKAVQTDAAGNTGPSSTALDITIDTIAPTISSIAVTSSAGGDNTYKAGDVITATVTFSESVVVDGNLQLALNIGGVTKIASFVGGSGTSALTFTYTILAGDTDTDGISFDADALTLSGGATIRDVAGTDATITSSPVADNGAHKVDTTAPTVVSVLMSVSALKIGDTSTLTITFTEAVTGFDNSDVTVQNGTIDTLQTGDGGITWTATFTPDTNIEDTSNIVTVASTYTDIGGNAGSGASSANYTIDTKAPTVVSVLMSDSALKIGDTSTVTITFSEPVTGFNSDDDVTVEKGVLSLMTSGDGVTWTGTFTPNALIEDTSNVVTVASTYTDVAGNTGSGAGSANYEVDTKAPTASVSMDDAALNIGDTATVTITFSEAVTGFSNADVTVENGTLDTFQTSDGGITWTATFTPNALVEDISNVVTLASTYTDLAGNGGTGDTSDNYTIDTKAPTVVSVVMDDTALKIGDTATVTITFSEAVTGFDNGDVTVENGTIDTLQTSDGGITWTAIFTPNAPIEDATNVVTVASTYTDGAGNAGSGATSANYAVDTKAPTVVAVIVADSALKIGETSLVVISFSEPVTGFSNADVTVEGGTLDTLVTSNGGLTWTATFTPTVNLEDGTNVVTVLSTYTDVAGNDGSGGVSNNYAIDTKAPTVVSALMSDSALKIGDTSTVTITFSEAVTGFDNSDVTFPNGTLSTLTSGDGGVTWTGTFTPNAPVEEETNVLTVASSYTDLAGNAGSGGTSTNYAIDTKAPTVVSVLMSDSALKIGDTSTLTITFSEAVTDFSNADVTVENGTLGTLTSGNGGITWTTTFTPNAPVEDASNVVTVAATYTDLATNAGSGGVSANYAIDTSAPLAPSIASIPENASGAISAAEAADGVLVNLSLSGTNAVAGDTLRINWGSQTFDYTLTGGDIGTSTAAVNVPLATINAQGQGAFDVTARVIDIAGNPSVNSLAVSVTVDTVAPNAPIALDLQPLSDTGQSDADNVTKESTPQFSGDAEIGSTVKLYDEATEIGSGLADGSGHWFITSTGLIDGAHSIKATATDAAGNVSVLSAALSVTIDTAGPSVSSVTYGTHDAALALGESVDLFVNFTEAVHINFTNGTPTLTLDTGGTANYVSGTGTNSLKFSYTVASGHTSSDLQVTSLNLVGSTIRDTAGNDASLAGAVTNPTGTLPVDTTAPTLAITVADTALTEGETTSVTFQFSETVQNFTLADAVAANGTLSNFVAVDGDTFTATLTPTVGVDDATNLVTVGTTWTDIAGNAPAGSTNSNNYTVDTTPVNVAPVLTGDLTATMDANTEYTITTADLNFSDPDDLPADVTFSISNQIHGTVLVNGVAATSFTGTQLAAGVVSFAHDGSAFDSSFSVSVEDGNEDSSTPTPETFTIDAILGAPAPDIFGTQVADNPLDGTVGSERIFGRNGNDVMDGDIGNDILIGGRGRDVMSGGDGADIFDFNKTVESGFGAAKRDTIADFDSGVDKIDLRTIDANTTLGGNQKFKFIGDDLFNKKAGELHVLNKFGFFFVEGDTNGDGRADFQIKVVGEEPLLGDILR